MRVLLIDNIALGHHPIYFRIVLEELLSMGIDVVYAFPQKLSTKGRHIEFQAGWADRLALRMQGFTGLPFAAWHNWRKLERLQKGLEIDRVFFLYLDRYLHPAYVRRFDVPWSGLYFHPRQLRSGRETSGPWRQLGVPECRRICTLDIGIQKQLQELTGKEVIKFPDLAEGEVEPDEFGRNVLLSAGSRPIVGVLGALSRSKNIGRALEIAQRNPQWHFVFAGPFFARSFSRRELALIKRGRHLRNVSWRAESMSDAALNYLHQLCAVIYAPYLDFLHSSNKLTKACLFRKPILVSRGYYMGEMVAKHGIGRLVDPLDVDALEAAIADLLRTPPVQPDYEGYLASNSRKILKEVLRAALS